MGHTHAVAEKIDGFIQVFLGKRTQFGLGLSVVQINFGQTEDRHVVVGLVHAAPFRQGLVHDELGYLITGLGAVQIRSRDSFISQIDIAGAHRDGGESGISILHFLCKLHGFPTRLIREAGAIGHEDAGHELTGETRVGLRHHHGKGSCVVAYLEALVILDGQDELILIGVHVRKELAVVVHLSQAVGTFGHQLLCGTCGLSQVEAGALGVGGKGHHIHFRVHGRVVVLAERSFVQAEAGLKGQSRPAVHAIGAHGRRKVRDSVVDVFQHMLHHHLTGIAVLVEFLTGSFQFLVVPRHVTEAADHAKVEVGTEKAGKGGVLDHGVLVLALAHGGQKSIHLAKVSPGSGTVAPAAAGGRHGAGVAATLYRGEALAHQLVAHFLIGLLGKQVVVERVGEQLKVCLTAEIVLGGHGRFGHPVQIVVAGSEADDQCKSSYE